MAKGVDEKQSDNRESNCLVYFLSRENYCRYENITRWRSHPSKISYNAHPTGLIVHWLSNNSKQTLSTRGPRSCGRDSNAPLLPEGFARDRSCKTVGKSPPNCRPQQPIRGIFAIITDTWRFRLVTENGTFTPDPRAKQLDCVCILACGGGGVEGGRGGASLDTI